MSLSLTPESTSSKKDPLFGLSIVPKNIENVFRLPLLAEELELDLIGIQDHPYNGSFLETWSLIGALAASTKKIHYFADVSDLPMRPPAMLAKTSGTLDILTRGRIVLGIGAGAFWDAIHSYGGPRRTPDEAVAALEEAIQVIRLLWNFNGPRRRVSFPGKYYQLDNAQAGPSPAHEINIWVGAVKPKMLRLIGRIGDGWVIPLSSYMSAEEIKAAQQIINDAAKKSGRTPDSISRIYNVIGKITVEKGPERSASEKTPFMGSSSQWVEWLVAAKRDLGIDTFVFWPNEGEEESQLRLFASGVIPVVRASLVKK